eukprot:CCRYP_003990-RA/>CCRYP_003990-RA protein AED:0.05 eAED:0.05 QI:169/1/1/1/0/0/2/148/154
MSMHTIPIVLMTRAPSSARHAQHDFLVQRHLRQKHYTNGQEMIQILLFLSQKWYPTSAYIAPPKRKSPLAYSPSPPLTSSSKQTHTTKPHLTTDPFPPNPLLLRCSNPLACLCHLSLLVYNGELRSIVESFAVLSFRVEMKYSPSGIRRGSCMF